MIRWEVLITWESSHTPLGRHVRSYTVGSLSQALKERAYINKAEPTATVTIRRVKQ